MNMMEALSITISSMTIVFLTLLTISLVLQSFTIIFKQKEDKKVTKNDEISIDKDNLEITEEERVVVALAASIMAGEGKINPNLHITKLTRIK